MTAEPTPDLDKNRNINSNRNRLALILAPLILIAGLLILFAVDNTPSTTRYQLENHQVLTRLPGVEEDPQLSPDGRLLLFRHKTNSADAFYQLYLKPMVENRSFTLTTNSGHKADQRIPSQRFQRAFALGKDNFSYRQAIFSSDGYQIYAVRTKVDKPDHCEIVALSLPVTRDIIIAQQRLTGCHRYGSSKLALNTNSGDLYFTDQRMDDRYQLYRYDFATTQIQQLTRPAEVGAGERFIHYSAANNKLLILRDIALTKTRFIAYDTTNADSRTLFERNWVYYTAFWGVDGRDIWLNLSNQKVIAYNPEDDSTSPLMSSASGWTYNAVPVSRTLAFYSISDANASDLIFHHSDFKNTQTLFAETYPVFANRSKGIAFVSNESGLPQIWFKRPGQGSVQVTDARRHYQISQLQYSADDEHILGLNGNQIVSIEINRQRFSIHYLGEVPAFHPRWFKDRGHIIFTRKDGQYWRLYQVAVTDKPESATPLDLKSGYLSQPIDDNKILFSRYEQDGFWFYDTKTGQQTRLLEKFPKQVFWRIAGQHVYFIKTIDGQRGLYKTPLTQFEPTLQSQLASTVRGYFDVKIDPDNGRESYVFTDFSRPETDLKSARIVYHDE